MISAEQARANKPSIEVKTVKIDKYSLDRQAAIDSLSKRLFEASLDENENEVYFDHENEKIFEEIIEILKKKGYNIEETELKGTVKINWEKS